MERLRLTVADYLIMVLLLLAGSVGIWINLQRGGLSEQKYLTIYVENEAVAELSFAPEDNFNYSFPFDEGRHRAILEIDGGRVRMLPLPAELCPRGICSHTGWITRSYESIVCLPNRILVVFTEVPSGEEDGVDSITF